jgi:uncharacterized surface protein with fasciclin (FAS1) repeats
MLIKKENNMIEETLPQVITQEQRETITNALKEMSASMTRVAAEKDLQKDIADRIKEECMVPKREFNKLAKIYHASSLVEEAAKNEEFIAFADAILNGVNVLENNG